MDREQQITTKLSSTRPTLSSGEKARVWSVVESSIPAAEPVLSPFTVTMIFKKTMPIALILAIIVSGGTATAFASDAARPGDLLFPLDRTIENIQLRLTQSEEARVALSKDLTEERLEELREIIDEEVKITPSNGTAADVATVSATSSADLQLQIEVHVYTDTTVVKIEFAGQKFYFETDAATLAEAVVDIQEHFPMLTIAQINNVVSLEQEDRVSRPKDRGVVTLSSEGEERINNAVEALLAFLDETASGSLNEDAILTTVMTEVESVTQSTRVARVKDGVEIGDRDDRVAIRIDDDGDSRIDIRTEDQRIRIEESNNKVSVQTVETVPAPTVGTEESPIESDIRIDVQEPLFEFGAYAEVFTDQTVIALEIGDDDLYITTEADTRDGIIAAIEESFPALSREQIEDALTVKVRNRASRPEDMGLPAVSEESTVDIPVAEDDDTYEHNDDDYEDGYGEDEDEEDGYDKEKDDKYDDEGVENEHYEDTEDSYEDEIDEEDEIEAEQDEEDEEDEEEEEDEED